MEIYIKEDILISFIFEKKKIPYDNIIITMKKNRCWHRRVMKKKPSRRMNVFYQQQESCGDSNIGMAFKWSASEDLHFLQGHI